MLDQKQTDFDERILKLRFLIRLPITNVSKFLFPSAHNEHVRGTLDEFNQKSFIKFLSKGKCDALTSN